MIPPGLMEMIFNRITLAILGVVLFFGMVACDVIEQRPTAAVTATEH